MTATATYDQAHKHPHGGGDGLPDPVSYGTFPNVNNPNSVTEQDFDHDFFYSVVARLASSRTFDSNAWVQDGFIRSVIVTE